MSRGPAQFMPREKGAAPLDIMIGIMAFLAALALGASLLAERAALGWRAGLADRLTVQILVPTHGDAVNELSRESDAALAVLRATPGIAREARVDALQQGDLAGSYRPDLPGRRHGAALAPSPDLFHRPALLEAAAAGAFHERSIDEAVGRQLQSPPA